MDITKKHSKLHRELQLDEYSIPFKDLDDIDNKKEFVDYVEYFQIDREYLLKQILKCKYLKFLHEYMKDDIIKILKYGMYELNDINLKYISQYIEIIQLNASNNENITTVEPFAETLQTLNASENCGIGDKGLKNAHNLVNLYAFDNDQITTVKPFAYTLKRLDARCYCGINNKGLKKACNLIFLNAYGNPKITTIKPFAKTLKILDASSECGINDNGLKEATRLEELYTEDNSKITTVKPFANTLKILYADYGSGIDDNGLEGTNLEELCSYNNPKITKKLNK